jgi:hypothetical protein
MGGGTYVLCEVEGVGYGGDGRCILGVSCDSLLLSAADPLLVFGILHVPDLASVMLEVQGEQTSSFCIPRLSRECDARAIESTRLRDVVRVQRTANAKLGIGAAEWVHRFLVTIRLSGAWDGGTCELTFPLCVP